MQFLVLIFLLILALPGHALAASPDIPAVVATQLMTSRSWLSRAKATRTISPLQQVNSSASEH